MFSWKKWKHTFNPFNLPVFPRQRSRTGQWMGTSKCLFSSLHHFAQLNQTWRKLPHALCITLKHNVDSFPSSPTVETSNKSSKSVPTFKHNQLTWLPSDVSPYIWSSNPKYTRGCTCQTRWRVGAIPPVKTYVLKPSTSVILLVACAWLLSSWWWYTQYRNKCIWLHLKLLGFLVLAYHFTFHCSRFLYIFLVGQNDPLPGGAWQ